LGERRGELGATVERIRALTRLEVTTSVCLVQILSGAVPVSENG
jgi:hypothetical protein